VLVLVLVLVLVGSVEQLWMIRWMIERSVVVCLLTRAGSAKLAQRLAGCSLIMGHVLDRPAATRTRSIFGPRGTHETHNRTDSTTAPRPRVPTQRPTQKRPPPKRSHSFFRSLYLCP